MTFISGARIAEKRHNGNINVTKPVAVFPGGDGGRTSEAFVPNNVCYNCGEKRLSAMNSYLASVNDRYNAR